MGVPPGGSSIQTLRHAYLPLLGLPTCLHLLKPIIETIIRYSLFALTIEVRSALTRHVVIKDSLLIVFTLRNKYISFPIVSSSNVFLLRLVRMDFDITLLLEKPFNIDCIS